MQLGAAKSALALERQSGASLKDPNAGSLLKNSELYNCLSAMSELGTTTQKKYASKL